MRDRLLIVGLDGATFEVLDPLMESGELPFLAGLARGGVTAELASTTPPVTPVAWSTFMTGMDPGKHRVLDFRRVRPRHDVDDFSNAGDLCAPTLWQRLSEAGLTVGVLNLPMTWPPTPVRGFIVSGFDTPPGSPYTYPAELQSDLEEEFPEYRTLPRWGRPPEGSTRRVRRLARRVAEVFEQRTAVGSWLASAYEPDVLMVQFQALDHLQHQAWGYLVAARGTRRPAVRGVRRALTTLDSCVRRLAEHPAFAGGDVVVVSDHGFGPVHGCLYPNVLLEEAGLLARIPDDTPPTKTRHPLRSLRWIDSLWSRAGYLRWQLQQRGDRREWIETLRAPEAPTLWELVRKQDTRAVMGMGELGAYVWVLPQEGDSRATVLARVREVFRSARLPDGEDAFGGILDGRDVCGDAEDPPDLLAIPAPGWKVSRDLAPRWWARADRQYGGTHRPEGVLLARGPGFRRLPGRQHVELADVAPTLLHRSGLPIPRSMDGTPRRELLTGEDEVRFTDEADPPPGPPRSAADDRENMEALLRGLGYLG